MTPGLALALFYTAGWISLYLIRAESIQDALPQYNRGERAWVVTSSVILSVHVTLSCMTASLTDPIPTRSLVLSALVFTAGIGFWVWARTMIAPLGTRRLPEEAPLELRRSGAFGVVRNPLYLGVLVAAGAPLVAVPRLDLAVTFALGCLALAVRSVQDEARLRDQLGAPYDAYCREVKRLVPFLW